MNDRLARGYVILTLTAGTALMSGAGAFQLFRDVWRLGRRVPADNIPIGAALALLSLITSAVTVIAIGTMFPTRKRSA